MVLRVVGFQNCFQVGFSIPPSLIILDLLNHKKGKML